MHSRPEKLPSITTELIRAAALLERIAHWAHFTAPRTAKLIADTAQILLQEHQIMSLFANAIHKLQQQLVDEKARADKAQADADKNAADAKSLADLRAGGFIADQSDVDAANEVLNDTPPADTNVGGTGADTLPSGTGPDTAAGAAGTA